MPNDPKKLILIDGNAIIHRSYHALPPLTTKKGELVNAVYGFSSTLLSVIDKFKPDYIAATFDLAGPTFRHKEYKEYKAKRVKADQELYDQIPRVKEVVRAMNIPIYEKEGFEADDVIGTLAKQIEKSGENVENIIVTGDLDTLQLVNPKTKVYTMRRGLSDALIYDEEKIKERYGLSPRQMIDFKGLRGDASDNIPGVKGIGEKTAIELIKKYSTLENVYKNLDEIKGAVREKLERDRAMAAKSKHLSEINQSVPVKIDLTRAYVHKFEREKIVELFKELNFYSLIKRLPDAKLRNVSESANQPSGVKDFKYEYISSDKLNDFIKELSIKEEVAIRLNARVKNILESEILGLSLSWKTGRAGYIEFNQDNFSLIKKILENSRIKKIGYDLKKDLEILKNNRIELEGTSFDVMLAAYVLNPGAKTQLETLVLENLGEEMAMKSNKGQLGLAIETPQETAHKFAREADYIFKLKQILENKIEKISAEQISASKRSLTDVFENLEMPLIPVLEHMEKAGIKLNPIIFKGIAEKITARIKRLEEKIFELAGGEFNINSSRQLAEILFTRLRISTQDIKKGKTGYSTASSELQKLKGQHKIIEKIEEYREIFKLKTTYLDTLPTMTDKNSRIHTTFNQAVTATGRLSSSDPNLQNIPIRTELGKLLRTAFEAERGYLFVSADYSQIDLRVVAHVSGDKKLIELFHRGEDIHRATAAEINKVSLSQVTQVMRSRAKALNFGIIYGMSVFGFSAAADVSRDEAKKFIDEYMNKFQGVAEYIRKTKEWTKKHEYVETEMGRRRYIPEINSPNFQVQNAAERMAVNMPIQGLAADIVKLAMIEIYKYVAKEKQMDANDIRMILQVHDEIILEVKENIADKVAKKIEEIMESAYKLKVPLIASIKIGENWGEI